MDESLKAKIEASRKAYTLAVELDKMVSERFEVYDLRVAATAEGLINISGKVKDENLKNEIESFLMNNNSVVSVTNSLETDSI